MRHRAPRPLLDLIRPRSWPVALRPTAPALAVVAVVGTVCAASGVYDESPGQGGSVRAVDPAESPSWLTSPDSDPTRDPAPTRPSSRGARQKASPTERPAPTRTRRADDERAARAEREAPPAPDLDAPETYASTVVTTPSSWQVQSSSDETATYECSLDGGAWQSCPARSRFSDLEPGQHTLAVRAVDASGNRDPSPAQLTFEARDKGHGPKP